MADILFLGKDNDPHCLKALEFCQTHFTNVTYFLGQWEEDFPEKIRDWAGDYLISFLSRWIVPEEVLKRATIAAINFHPAPPEYPGNKCYNFALYEQAKKYGVTCHHMTRRVDSGKIIAVKRFEIHPKETLASLITRAYDCQLDLFYEVMALLRKNEKLPLALEKWREPPFTNRDFDTLKVITPNMDKSEFERRIRATSYGKWQPSVKIHGFKFVLEGEE